MQSQLVTRRVDLTTSVGKASCSSPIYSKWTSLVHYLAVDLLHHTLLKGGRWNAKVETVGLPAIMNSCKLLLITSSRYCGSVSLTNASIRWWCLLVLRTMHTANDASNDLALNIDKVVTFIPNSTFSDRDRYHWLKQTYQGKQSASAITAREMEY